MAQEKQRPPLAKAAQNGERSKKKGKSPIPPIDSGGSKVQAKPPKLNIPDSKLAEPKMSGQPGGPNVRPIAALKNSDEQPLTNHSYPPKRGEGDTAFSGQDRTNDDDQDRRRAAPARRRFAANDDVPSIGGLIFALQQKPSNRPFVIAAIASAVWAALSTGMVWSVFSSAFTGLSSPLEVFQSTASLATLAAVTIPIALFWFLALLIWRAHELRLMSSAMTEVAVRLAEPDKAAEQSVASLGQSVRRQVTAMNDAISRALGRASELEAMVHNEVAALERSYSENEHRIRNLIGDLAHERTALTSDSERISSALTGIGQKLTHQIEQQGNKTTQQLEKTSVDVASQLIESSEKITQSMSKQSNSVVSSMTTMNDRVGREMPVLLERMDKEQTKLNKVIEHASTNLSALDTSIGRHAGALNNALTDRTQQIEGVFRKHVQTMSSTMEERSQTLDNSLNNKIQTFDNTLLQRMDDFEDTLTNTTQKIDTTLSNKAQYLDLAISSRVAELDSALIERTKVIDAAFTERLQALDGALHTSSKTLDQAFAHRAEELGRSMDARSQYIVQTIGAKTKELDNALMSGAKTLQLTTEDVGKQVMSTIHGLAGQAQVLKEVSGGMQNHVNQITNSLREQSQMVITAAAQLENSHDRIGSKLGNSQVNLQNLVEAISTRTSDLDHVMASYSNQLESTLSQAEVKAQEITKSLHTRSATQSMEALSELTKLRDAATNQTERAIHDMKDRIAAVSNEMSSQITTLSSEISDTQNNLKQQLQHIPDTTRKNASLMRRTLQDQLKALESLSSLSSSGHADISAPGLNNAPLNTVSSNDAYKNQTLSDFDHTPPPVNTQSGYPKGQVTNEFGQAPQTRTEPQRTSLLGQNLTGQDNPGFLNQNLSASNISSDRDKEIEAITQTLAKQVTEQMTGSNIPEMKALPAGGIPLKQGSSHWSMGDLLARASEDESANAQMAQEDLRPSPTMQPEPLGANQGLPPININAIAQLVDQTAAVELWRNYRSGLRTHVSDTVYNDNGEAFRKISTLYKTDMTFRSNVDRYTTDFERLLTDVEKKDPHGNLTTKHITSESGRVYLLLMHAAGRIGN